MKITRTLKHPLLLAATLLTASVLLVSCGGGGSSDTSSVDTGSIKVFDKYTAPANLSSWQFLLSDGQTLKLNAGAVPYDLNSSLFSDYTFKIGRAHV